MKRLFLIFLLLPALITGIASAEESFKVSYTVTPFESKVSGLQKPVSKEITIHSGDSVNLDLGVFTAAMTVEKAGKLMAFSFDRDLELFINGITAEVRKVTVEEYAIVHLRTPTKDAGAWLDISWGPDTIPLIYQDFIRSVSSIYDGNESGRYGAYEDYSVMFNVQSGWEKEKKTLGYTTMDLDDDGTEELLFGDSAPDMDGTPLYDMYTIRNGELVHVFDGWDRNRYYLSPNGEIIRQGSDSAFRSFTAYYIYTNSEMRLFRSVIYDSSRNADRPWYLSFIDAMDSSTGFNIREDEAQSIMKNYSAEKIDLTPFG